MLNCLISFAVGFCAVLLASHSKQNDYNAGYLDGWKDASKTLDEYIRHKIEEGKRNE